MSDDIDNKYIKIVLIGETGTGKTNLINVYFGIKFENNVESTLTPESCSKDLKINGSNFLINIWDTAGQEKYRSMTKIFLKGTKIVILVYDITNKNSFDELNFWIKSVEELLGTEPTLGLVGNKIDLFDKQQVSKEEGKKLANEIGAVFAETSAKEDAKGFQDYITKLVETFLTKKGIASNEKQTIELGDKKNKKACC